MKKIALALALLLTGSSLAVGLIATDANAGAAGKICKQALLTHPIPGTHHEQMKRCKAEYKAYKKTGGVPTT